MRCYGTARLLTGLVQCCVSYSRMEVRANSREFIHMLKFCAPPPRPGYSIGSEVARVTQDSLPRVAQSDPPCHVGFLISTTLFLVATVCLTFNARCMGLLVLPRRASPLARTIFFASRNFAILPVAFVMTRMPSMFSPSAAQVIIL